MATLRVTYRVSTIGHNQRHKDTVRSLGLRRLNQTVELPDRPEVRGMIRKVSHFLTVEESSDSTAAE
ncbi:MAG TPA: 50S ribosomal protein L30 [Chloroflexota bacterium]|jgi:large subunit ribosomal protein L30